MKAAPKMEEAKAVPSRNKNRSISPSKKIEGLLVPDEKGLIELQFNPAKHNLVLTELDRVSIVSEFTGWMLETMAREERGEEVIYIAKYVLKPGFKYKFRFVLNGSPIGCQEYPEIKNIMRQSYNYIVVTDMKHRLTRRASYTNLQVDPQARQDGIQKYFRPIFKKTKKGENAFPEDLKMHVGRILYRYKKPEGFYKLLKWNKYAKEATLRRISDNNGIPLDVKKFTKQEYYFLNELNSQFFFVGSKDEESAALNMLNHNKLNIKYKKSRELTNAPAATYYEIVAIQPDNIPLQEVFCMDRIVLDRL